MKIELHRKESLADPGGRYKRHPIVCRYRQAEDALLVYATPYFHCWVGLALMVDENGKNESLNDEAAFLLMGLINLGRLPRLVEDD